MAKMVLSGEEMLAMDPIELMERLRDMIKLPLVHSIDTKQQMEVANAVMAKSISYIVYFTELETMARLEKRAYKQSGGGGDRFNQLLGCEEVFAAYRKIAEARYDQVTKLMTMKRLEIDEDKRNYNVT